MAVSEERKEWARPSLHPSSRRVVSPSTVLPALAVGAMVAAYAVLFGWLSLRHYWAYDMHALDMGNMGQAAWNTVHGHPFYFTNMRLAYFIEAWHTTTRLSFHVEALFPIISLVYLIYPHPESLLLLQTGALALGALPVFLLARDVLGSRWFGVLFAMAYLLLPSLEAMNLYEFHPVSLATPLLLFAFLFMFRRQHLPAVLCCLAAMGCKEEIGLIVAMFGLHAALVQRDRRIGFSLVVVGVTWSLLAAGVIEHHFRQPPTLTYMRSRYGYLGHGVQGAFHTVIHDPGAFGRVLLTWPKAGYVIRLLAPTGFTALLAPGALLLGAPTLLLNLFSTDFHMSSGVGHNSAELISVEMIASILGTRTLIRLLETRLPRRVSVVAATLWIVGLMLWNQYQDGFTPAGAMYQVPTIGPHQKLADRFVAMIPGGAPVSTQDQLDPHLSSRHYVYLFEDTGREGEALAPANHILLDVSAPTYPLPSWQLYDRANKWLHTRGWGVAAADDGLILISRGARSAHIPPRFYRFALAPGAIPSQPLHFADHGFRLVGYDRARQDLANNHVPVLAYTFYLRRTAAVRVNYQPVVYEVVGKSLIGCAADPLGLSWLPTSRWASNRTFRVRMNPLPTDWQSEGTARLYAELRPIPRAVRGKRPDCGTLWSEHGKVTPVGTLDIGY